MPGWLKTWLIIAAIVGGGALLVLALVSFAAVLVAILAPLAIVAWAINRFRSPAGPATVEGVVVKSHTLTEEERARLAATPVWVVWYEDQFHVGAERDSFGKAVCFSEADARAWVTSSGSHMLEPGFDGCEILGPENPLATSLFSGQEAEILGAILERLARGSTEPIPMRIL